MYYKDFSEYWVNELKENKDLEEYFYNTELYSSIAEKAFKAGKKCGFYTYKNICREFIKEEEFDKYI